MEQVPTHVCHAHIAPHLNLCELARLQRVSKGVSNLFKKPFEKKRSKALEKLDPNNGITEIERVYNVSHPDQGRFGAFVVTGRITGSLCISLVGALSYRLNLSADVVNALVKELMPNRFTSYDCCAVVLGTGANQTASLIYPVTDYPAVVYSPPSLQSVGYSFALPVALQFFSVFSGWIFPSTRSGRGIGNASTPKQIEIASAHVRKLKNLAARLSPGAYKKRIQTAIKPALTARARCRTRYRHLMIIHSISFAANIALAFAAIAFKTSAEEVYESVPILNFYKSGGALNTNGTYPASRFVDICTGATTNADFYPQQMAQLSQFNFTALAVIPAVPYIFNALVEIAYLVHLVFIMRAMK